MFNQRQRAEAERRAAEEQQRVASRRYIGRGWELDALLQLFFLIKSKCFT